MYNEEYVSCCLFDWLIDWLIDWLYIIFIYFQENFIHKTFAGKGL